MLYLSRDSLQFGGVDGEGLSSIPGPLVPPVYRLYIKHTLTHAESSRRCSPG